MMDDNQTWEMVEKKSDPHICSTPRKPGQGVGVGDLIRCKECGQHWKCTGTDSGMQWDSYRTVLVYKRVGTASAEQD